MRSIVKVVSLLLLCFGVALLTWGVARYRLPYEDGRYFDAKTAVVYDVQTAEVLVIAGIVLTLAGLVIAFLTALSRRGRKGGKTDFRRDGRAKSERDTRRSEPT